MIDRSRPVRTIRAAAALALALWPAAPGASLAESAPAPVTLPLAWESDLGAAMEFALGQCAAARGGDAMARRTCFSDVRRAGRRIDRLLSAELEEIDFAARDLSQRCAAGAMPHGLRRFEGSCAVRAERYRQAKYDGVRAEMDVLIELILGDLAGPGRDRPR